MIYLGWTLCPKCAILERRTWAALKKHVKDPKVESQIARLVLAGSRKEKGNGEQ